MDTDEERRTWWTAASEDAALAWVAARSATPERHLGPVHAVGRTGAGALVIELLRPAGPSIAVALDRIGTPSVGVAVTLTSPLVDLAVDAVRGAVLLGPARSDDVVVDDSGAVVLCDRPTDAAPLGDGSSVESGLAEGISALLLAVRIVWERVDPQEPCRPGIDAAIVAARSGDPDALVALREAVRDAGAPRPVRWDPPAGLFSFEEAVSPAPGPESTGSAVDAVIGRVRDVVERGVPVGGRWVPVRQVGVGVVVAVGVVVSAVMVLGR
ncbi:hypothetical protein [Curtobacterium luteum]|uniref:Uncharacterized protein n=1 Tax=Curtobacterium luteum TaxID=33881 RepID=A0A175REX0_9MICO|nr:hypothetical protein [Curtobacterium luteum]KTR02038.1 hypothetical protein NS184_17015 [Curtobacterium luteum]